MTSLDKLKRRMVASTVRAKKNLENQKYGEFIVQTNKVQVLLALAVLRRSSLPDKPYIEYLFERAEFGVLIGLFQTSAPKTFASYKLLLALKRYNEIRRRLAHKMYSPKRLTPEDCTSAILEGEAILMVLRRIAKIRI